MKTSRLYLKQEEYTPNEHGSYIFQDGHGNMINLAIVLKDYAEYVKQGWIPWEGNSITDQKLTGNSILLFDNGESRLFSDEEFPFATVVMVYLVPEHPKLT